jgi:hypothetical protein
VIWLENITNEIVRCDPACLLDAELFDGPPHAEAGDDRAAREQVARELCLECPARTRCLAYALATRPDSGVWAGLTAGELALMVSASALRPAASPARRTFREVA